MVMTASEKYLHEVIHMEIYILPGDFVLVLEGVLSRVGQESLS